VPEQCEPDLELNPPRNLGSGLVRRLVSVPGELNGLVVYHVPTPAQGPMDGVDEEACALLGGPMCFGE